jgi:hypothetical protein
MNKEKKSQQQQQPKKKRKEKNWRIHNSSSLNWLQSYDIQDCDTDMWVDIEIDGIELKIQE